MSKKTNKIDSHGKVKVDDVNEAAYITDEDGKKIPVVRDVTNSNKVIRTAELVPSMKAITKDDVDEFVKDFKNKHDIKDVSKKENKKKEKDDDSSQTEKEQ